MTRIIPTSHFATTSSEHTSPDDPPILKDVEVLILGAGWTSTFLLPLLQEKGVDYAATTRDGRNGTIPFTFDPESQDHRPFYQLPRARTVLITFPLQGKGQSRRLLEMWWITHIDLELRTNFIQLGSTGIYKNEGWSAWDSPYDKENERAIAEDELLELWQNRACVLNLAGLYGGERQLRHWLPRVARSKQDCAGKGAVHMIHGNDVARAIFGAHQTLCAEWEPPSAPATHEPPFKLLEQASNAMTTKCSGIDLPNLVGAHRFPITDLHSYDWWDLFMQFGSYARERAIAGETKPEILKGAKPEELLYEKWVLELMEEKGVRALPRDNGGLGRLVDGRAFWAMVGCWPVEGRADRRH